MNIKIALNILFQPKIGFTPQRALPTAPFGQPQPPPIVNVSITKQDEGQTKDLVGKKFESQPVVGKELAKSVGNQSSGFGAKDSTSSSSGPSNPIEKSVQGPSKPNDESLEDWNCQKCEAANFYFRPNCKGCGAKKVEVAAVKSNAIEPVAKVSQLQNAQPNVVSL